MPRSPRITAVLDTNRFTLPAVVAVVVATNLGIDHDLLVRAVQVSGERTKKAAVTKALHEFIARREQRRVADLLGKIEWDSAFDYKAERTRRA